MQKRYFIHIAVMALLALTLAACAPAGTTSTLPASEPGSAAGTPDAAPGVVTQPTAEGAAAGLCVGVDTAQLMTAGEALYTDNCADCHGAQGEGMGDFPSLTANATVTGEDIIGLVQGYLAVDAHPKELTSDDLAAVLTYTRGAFGNTAPAICPADIEIPVQ